MQMAFLPGTELARRYYTEVVRPLLDRHAPGLGHSAGLIGWGSEVLGFDSPRSTDHNWGPRGQIFVAAGDADRPASLSPASLSRMLADKLPATFLGWPTQVSRCDGAKSRAGALGAGRRAGSLADRTAGL